MQILLSELPADVFALRGVYGDNEDQLPRRVRYLRPEAAASMLRLVEQLPELRLSDVLRSAESSLAAVAAGRGAQPPGYSGHNFGNSVDLAVDRVLRDAGVDYGQLVAFMGTGGWACHRRDGKRGKEDWHFNYFGGAVGTYVALTDPAKPGTWARAVGQLITDQYGAGFTLSPLEVQAALAKVGLYSGELDGDIGPLSRAAIAAFRRTWKLPPAPPGGPSGVTDLRLQRTLAFVAADKQIVPIPA